MIPTLDGLDHIHVYVKDRNAAARWYEQVLGFVVTEALTVWAENPNGPLTIEDASGRIHLALFTATAGFKPSTAIAMRSDGDSFLAWKSYLEDRDMLLRCTDHKLAWSLYFNDLDGNMHEITSYDHAAIAAALAT